MERATSSQVTPLRKWWLRESVAGPRVVRRCGDIPIGQRRAWPEWPYGVGAGAQLAGDPGWFLVHLSPSHSVLEPVIYNDVIVVGAPEEDYRKSSGEAVRAAGAAYLIDKQDSTWGVRRNFVSAVPRKHALLGHNLATRSTLEPAIGRFKRRVWLAVHRPCA